MITAGIVVTSIGVLLWLAAFIIQAVNMARMVKLGSEPGGSIFLGPVVGAFATVVLAVGIIILVIGIVFLFL